MKPAKKQESVENVASDFERAISKAPGKETYVLRLYITGMTPASQTAIRNIKKISEEFLKGRYDLEIIDIYQRPQLAEGEQIVAAPTLIKELPAPLRRFVGDLSDKEKVLIGLDIKRKGAG